MCSSSATKVSDMQVNLNTLLRVVLGINLDAVVGVPEENIDRFASIIAQAGLPQIQRRVLGREVVDLVIVVPIEGVILDVRDRATLLAPKGDRLSILGVDFKIIILPEIFVVVADAPEAGYWNRLIVSSCGASDNYNWFCSLGGGGGVLTGRLCKPTWHLLGGKRFA